MNHPRILITGAAGFIGFHLQKSLQNHADLVLYDELVSHQFASMVRSQSISNLITETTDSELVQLLNGVDVIIHLAAETGISQSLNYPRRYLDSNVSFTMRLLDAAHKAGVKNFMYASSSSVYSPYTGEVEEIDNTDIQLSFYGTTKKMMEQMITSFAKQSGMRAIGLRFFTVYGSWTRPDMAAYKFMKAISKQEPITIYNPNELQRDFTHVSDVVKAIIGLQKRIKTLKPGQHELFNVGYGSPVLVADFAKQIAAELNLPLFIYPGQLPLNEAISTHSNVQKLYNFLGFKPQVSVSEGVYEMVEWFKSSPYE